MQGQTSALDFCFAFTYLDDRIKTEQYAHNNTERNYLIDAYGALG